MEIHLPAMPNVLSLDFSPAIARESYWGNREHSVFHLSSLQGSLLKHFDFTATNATNAKRDRQFQEGLSLPSQLSMVETFPSLVSLVLNRVKIGTVQNSHFVVSEHTMSLPKSLAKLHLTNVNGLAKLIWPDGQVLTDVILKNVPMSLPLESPPSCVQEFHGERVPFSTEFVLPASLRKLKLDTIAATESRVCLIFGQRDGIACPALTLANMKSLTRFNVGTLPLNIQELSMIRVDKSIFPQRLPDGITKMDIDVEVFCRMRMPNSSVDTLTVRTPSRYDQQFIGQFPQPREPEVQTQTKLTNLQSLKSLTWLDCHLKTVTLPPNLVSAKMSLGACSTFSCQNGLRQLEISSAPSLTTLNLAENGLETINLMDFKRLKKLKLPDSVEDVKVTKSDLLSEVVLSQACRKVFLSNLSGLEKIVFKGSPSEIVLGSLDVLKGGKRGGITAEGQGTIPECLKKRTSFMLKVGHAKSYKYTYTPPSDEEEDGDEDEEEDGAFDSDANDGEGSN